MQNKNNNARRFACLALLLTTAPAFACGYHDPTLFAQAVTNHLYPNALHITGAIASARRDGYLPPLDVALITATGDERKALDRAALERTITALCAIGLAIDETVEQGSETGVSVLILESMMWTRYSAEYFDVRQGIHTKGPADGDVVLITEALVVQAIQDGTLSIERAVELGVMRVYADDQQREELLARFGSIGEAPLESPRFMFAFDSVLEIDPRP